MYLPATSMERDRLRQGDLLAGVPFPVLIPREIRVLGEVVNSTADTLIIQPASHTHRQDSGFFVGQVPMKLAVGMVISQCCDLEPRHGKMSGAAFNVARIIPIRKAILDDPTKLDSLRQNKDPRSSDPGYIGFFYIAPHEVLNNQELMVDYSQVVSLPTSMFPEILTHKLAQLDAITRLKLKIKLAVSLARLTEEERGGDPWFPTDSGSAGNSAGRT